MSLENTVVLTHMSLRLVPKTLDKVDAVPLVREELAVIDPVVVKIGLINNVVTTPAVLNGRG